MSEYRGQRGESRPRRRLDARVVRAPTRRSRRTRSAPTPPTCACSPSGWRSGITSPDGVARTLVRRYVAYLSAREFARRSIARKAASIRRYFEWAVAEGRVENDPTIGLHVAGGSGRLPRVLDGRELGQLLDGATPDDEPVWRKRRDDAVLEVLYGSGLRVSELCGLELQQIRLDEQALVVWGKGAKERRVPLGRPAADALSAWLAIRPDVVRPDAGPMVFANERGKRLTPRDVRRILDRRSPTPTIRSAAAHVRHPSARRRRRPAVGPGTARSLRRGNDPALHSREPRAAEGRLQQEPPTSMSIVPDDPDLAMHWARWLHRKNAASREHLIVHYSPLVKFVAGRVGAGLPSSVDPGDLVSSGVFGLIDAIDRFDPDRGVKFETFAAPASGARSTTGCASSTGCRARCAADRDVERRLLRARAHARPVAHRRRAGRHLRHRRSGAGEVVGVDRRHHDRSARPCRGGRLRAGGQPVGGDGVSRGGDGRP